MYFLNLFMPFVGDACVVCGVQRTTCRKLFPSFGVGGPFVRVLLLLINE